MKEVDDGVVDRKETKSLIAGGGGVGKSHLVAALLKRKPPSKRVSTSCAETLPWLLSSLQVQKSLMGIMLLTDEMHTGLMMKQGTKVESVLFKKGDLSSLPLKATEWKAAMSEELALEDTVPTFSEVDLHFLNGRKHMKKFEHTSSQVFGRIVDVGGQPQLLELLPRFIRDLTLGAVVIDLSQGLDKYPITYFYGANGKSIGRGIRSNLTNEQISRVVLQMIASLCTEEKKVKIIIVGTHRDVEWLSFESREVKEDRLKAIISSFKLEDNVITDETHNSLIFAMNVKNPKQCDRDTAEKIMSIMMREEDAVEVSIPIKHHKLELTAQMLLGPKRIALPFDELYRDMSCHYGSREAMAEGLQYLNNSFRLFYFKEFPELVFGVPQRLLNLMTEITVYHIRLTTNPNQAATSLGMWKLFKEQGIVNASILEKISSSYDDIFTPRHMLEVMEKLSIVCKIKKEKYLMPSLLTALATLPQSQSSWWKWLPFGLGNYFQRLVSDMKSDITMLAYFPVGLSRFGVYCGTVCELISEYKWEVIKEVSRNRFRFTQPGSAGVVTFIDSFDSFFIVNLEFSSEFSSESISSICDNVKQTIFSTIRKVTAELGYTPSDPVVAFLCDHDSSSPHVAEYLSEFSICLRCIKDKGHTTQLTDKHQLWLKNNLADSRSNDVPSLEKTEVQQASVDTKEVKGSSIGRLSEPGNKKQQTKTHEVVELTANNGPRIHASANDAASASSMVNTLSSKSTANPLTIGQLKVLRWTDSQHRLQKLDLINEMSPDWKSASDLLGLTVAHTRRIEMNYHTVEERCREVMVEWLSHEDGTYEYFRTWDGLCQLLEGLELSTLSKKLHEEILPNLNK